MSDLQRELGKLIRKVFDNEDGFIETFLSDYKKVTDVTEFYMASERCRVAFTINYDLQWSTTIKTIDFLNWAGRLKDEE